MCLQRQLGLALNLVTTPGDLMRRPLPRVNRCLSVRKSGLLVLPTVSVFALLVYIWAAHRVIQKWSTPADTGRLIRCVSWRRTHTCSSFGLVASLLPLAWISVTLQCLCQGARLGLGQGMCCNSIKGLRILSMHRWQNNQAVCQNVLFAGRISCWPDMNVAEIQVVLRPSHSFHLYS